MVVVDGKATLSRPECRYDANGIPLPQGPSSQAVAKWMFDWWSVFNQIAPWQFVYDPSDIDETNPISMYRDLSCALQLILLLYFESEICFGHTKYHYSEISDTIVCDENSYYFSELEIPLGANVHEFEDILIVSVPGDGGHIPHTPNGTPTQPFAFLRPLALNEKLHHSQLSGIPVFMSQLSDSDLEVVDLMEQVNATLPSEGVCVVYSEKYDVHLVYRYQRFDNGDWPWRSKFISGTLNHKFRRGLPSVTKWDHGDRVNLDTSKLSCKYHCLLKGLSKDIDMKTDEVLEQEEWSGYRLTSPDGARDFAKCVSNTIEKGEEQGLLDTSLMSKEEIHDVRKEICIVQMHGFIYETEMNINHGIFDVCHCWWSFIVRILMYFIATLWCVWHWDYSDVMDVVRCLEVPWIEKQVQVYLIEKNSSRNFDFKWTLATNGTVNKYVMRNINRAIIKAVQIIDNGSDESDYQMTMLLSMHRFTLLMRKSFAIVMKEKFVFDRSGNCKILNQMIEMARLATHLAYQTWTHLV